MIDPDLDPIDVISYGGGVQSTAMIVLAATGRFEPLGINVEHALFANVGDDSEHPKTIAYVRDVMTPWAAEHGVTVHELRRRRRDGSVAPSLLEDLADPASRSIRIPLRMANGAPGTRSCTDQWKSKVIQRWLRERGGTSRVCIGFSVDEIERVGTLRVTIGG